MSKFAIRLLTLAVCATALVVVPTVTPAKAETSSSKHIKKHKRKIQRSSGFGDPWSAGQAWPVARPPSRAGWACPGSGRSFSVERGLLPWMRILIERRQAPISDGSSAHNADPSASVRFVSVSTASQRVIGARAASAVPRHADLLSSI